MINRNNATQAQRRRYHILKTDPEAFQAVLSGAKTFEIRLNDRAYAVGDVLGLRETKHTGAEMRAGAPLIYTGRECQRFVSHVLTGYGLVDGWCCLSFRLPHAAGESIPVPGLAVAWAAIPSRGTRAGRIYTTCDTRKEIDAYIELVHQSNDSLTLTPRPLSFADAAPQASAEARPNNDAVDLARAGMALHAPGAPEHAVRAQLVRLADALKQPQADKGAAPCTCPSGDGSLRHPCPMHPGADKDGGQQRAGDAEQWRWATATDENAQMLYTIVQPYGGDQQKINERADFYRAALSTRQAEQGERDA